MIDVNDEAEVRRHIAQLQKRVAELEGAIAERKQAEKALVENEELFRVLTDKSPVGIFRIHPDGNCVYANDAAVHLAGLARGEELGDKWMRAVHPDDLGRVRETRERALETKTKWGPLEYRFIRDGRTKAWVRAEAQPIFSADGSLLGFVGGLIDMTERRRTEEALRQYERIVSSTTDMLALVDENYTYRAANAAYLQAFAKTPDEVIGRSVTEVFGEEFFSTSIRPRAERCMAGEDICYQGWIEFPATGRKYIDVTYSPYRGPDARIQGFVVTARDITERKQTEMLSMEQARLLNLIFEHTLDSIVLLDKDYNFIRVSETYAKACQRDSSEFPGHNHFEFYPSNLKDELDEAKRGKYIYRKYARPFIFPDHPEWGTTYWDLGLVPILDKEGEIELFLFTLKDVTERKRIAEENARLEAEYHQAQKVESIGRLAGGVAHDLNNLLSPILGYAEMLLDDFNPEDVRRESVDQILFAGFRARDLVRQLLAFGRKQTLKYMPVDMNRVTDNFRKLLRHTIREDIEIEVIPSPDLGAIMADIGQIEQVIMNLAINAQDAMPEGGHLTIETVPADLVEDDAAGYEGVQPGKYVLLRVSDTGSGVDDETRKHLFEPFYSTKGEHGTGLGLATVYGIVRQHGGNVRVCSEPGKGTTFKVYLPVSEEAHVEEITREKTSMDLGGSETILLVEDNEQVSLLAHSILKRQGYRVLVAGNGPEALTVLASYDDPVHLLLTDVVMPEMNGKELFTQISEMYSGLKVLYMSGYTDNVIVHSGVLEEGTAFIKKPFTVKALASKVREVLTQG